MSHLFPRDWPTPAFYERTRRMLGPMVGSMRSNHDVALAMSPDCRPALWFVMETKGALAPYPRSSGLAPEFLAPYGIRVVPDLGMAPGTAQAWFNEEPMGDPVVLWSANEERELVARANVALVQTDLDRKAVEACHQEVQRQQEAEAREAVRQAVEELGARSLLARAARGPMGVTRPDLDCKGALALAREFIHQARAPEPEDNGAS